MDQSISARRVATLLGDFDRSPAYAGLADGLRVLVGDGRIGHDVRLPSERELMTALEVSRTTVTRAYAALRDGGYAAARQGAGTFTRLPGGPAHTLDRALLPRACDHGAVDLTCAAPSAPAGLAEAYAAASADLPRYLGGTGYYPGGLPVLQEALAAAYDARGLPTSPEQVLVTPGALAGTAIVAQALSGRRDRVLVESPTYPNATQAVASGGARLVAAPVDPDGWDLDAVAASARQARARLAYLIPDFQNPTGLLLDDDGRAHLAAALVAARTVPVVDEAHQALALDGQTMPAPFAVHDPQAITVGSASKSHWGGLRVGWIRAPRDLVDRLTRARVALDLGVPVLEQLVVTHLLAAGDDVLAPHRDRLREQRDHLAAAVTERLPGWRFRLPAGGLALWCELPRPLGTDLARRAEEHGVLLAPGPVFAVGGGLNRWVRLPYARPAADLDRAVDGLAAAWADIATGPQSDRRAARTGRRVLVA